MSGLKRLTKFSLAASAAAAALTIFAPGASAQAQQVSANAISIESQDLGDALRTLARQTGTQVVFDPATVNGRRAPAVTGANSPEQALRRLLADSGLTYRSTGTGTYTILVQATEAPPTRLGAADPAASSEDEIIVTAQKREERLQDVPISITVLNGDQLDISTSEGVSEALNRVPGVATLPSFQGGGTQVTIRGAAAAGALFYGSNPVAYYIDGVPFGLVKSAIAPDTSAYDLDRVEVLRGPQGTLYSASALNGVVRVLTHDADLSDFEFKARTSVSSTEGGGQNHRGDVAVNLPIIDDVFAARVVVGYQDLSGWIDRPNNEDANDSQISNVRVRLRAEPTQNLSIGWSSWLSYADASSPPFSADDGTLPSSRQEPVSTDLEMHGLTLGYDFESFSLTSTTGWLQYATGGDLDLQVLAVPLTLFTGLDSDVFSQDLLLSSSGAGSWRWTLGAMYREGEDRTLQYFTDNATGAIAVPDYEWVDRSESSAVFGEITRLFFNGEVELTGGLRYFEDEVSSTEGAPGVAPLLETSASFDALTPRVVLTWHPDDQSTVYASYSQGFRSGFDQFLLAKTVLGLPPVEPDTLTNYEIGARGNAWNGRLTYDAALYFIDWQDLQHQLSLIVAGVPRVANLNAGSASGFGVDLGLGLEVTDNFDLGISVGWNDLTFDDDVMSGGFVLIQRGDRINNAPELTISATADYTFSLGGGFEGHLSGSANYLSEQNLYALLGTPYATVGDELLYARASFAIEAPTHWRTTLFIDNIGNEDGTAIDAPVGVQEWSMRARPRTVGIQLDYRF